MKLEKSNNYNARGQCLQWTDVQRVALRAEQMDNFSFSSLSATELQFRSFSLFTLQ